MNSVKNIQYLYIVFILWQWMNGTQSCNQLRIIFIVASILLCVYSIQQTCFVFPNSSERNAGIYFMRKIEGRFCSNWRCSLSISALVVSCNHVLKQILYVRSVLLRKGRKKRNDAKKNCSRLHFNLCICSIVKWTNIEDVK